MSEKFKNKDAVEGGGSAGCARNLLLLYIHLLRMPDFIYINNAIEHNFNPKKIGYSLAYVSLRLHKKYSHFSVTHSSFYNHSINVKNFSTSLAANNPKIMVKDNKVSVYKNIYEGRGVPNPEPFLVKSNGYPIGLLGAS